MIEVEAKINNGKGIHARPSRDIVVLCRSFQSKISLRRKNRSYLYPTNNILFILTGAFIQGETIVVRAEGPDEIIAANKVALLIENFKYC
jgi:phosphotransferase system HPr (HPr) family protein